ncbi:MAG TPA: lysine--tRNA ligase, partial [Candidatus Limnocylindrales bacterium]|nr:lysine--tRNA ligase [Candidatus Limnocylindrales bacterium]
MDWLDDLAARVGSGPQVVNDSKTPSGTVHVGSLRGPVLCDAIWRALRERGIAVHFLYGVEDLDPMDNQALLSGDAVERYMGAPLANVPAPPGSVEPSYAREFMRLFLGTFAGLGIRPEVYWMSELYASGAMDPYIRLVLDRADRVRTIYERVARVRHPASWHPVSVVCERCGKVGTTIVTAWDGERVRYECRPDLVTWARGCGESGWVSPFGGRAKLPWNIEWAAQWSHFGVTIEPSGKDLSTAGGSRDRSEAIAREVFEREPPLNVPYEFVNVGGKKMSTSKGRGVAAHRIAEVVPPEQLRFLFLRHRPNQVIDFEPEGTDAIPRLFDEFDRLAAATAGVLVKGELPAGYERIFRLSLVDPDADPEAEAAAYRPPFRHLALLVQISGVDIAARVEAEKGAPLTERERAILEERVRAARAWLATYAPPSERLEVRREALPAEAADLDPEQRRFLGLLAEAAERERPASGDAWQATIFSVAAEAGLP